MTARTETGSAASLRHAKLALLPLPVIAVAFAVSLAVGNDALTIFVSLVCVVVVVSCPILLQLERGGLTRASVYVFLAIGAVAELVNEVLTLDDDFAKGTAHIALNTTTCIAMTLAAAIAIWTRVDSGKKLRIFAAVMAVLSVIVPFAYALLLLVTGVVQLKKRQ